METVFFVCPHGAAKSVLAAAYFQHLAHQHGLPYHAVCGGTEPEAAIAPPVLAWLLAEGFPIPNPAPQLVTPQALAAATRVVTLNCDLERLMPIGLAAERWDDVPPVSEDLPTARAAIYKHVEKLVHELNAQPKRHASPRVL